MRLKVTICVAIVLLVLVGLQTFSRSAMAQTPTPVPCYGNGCTTISPPPPPPPTCTMQKTESACVYMAGSMGIPKNYTVGIAYMHFNTCTGETFYDYGCSPLQPVTQTPPQNLMNKLWGYRSLNLDNLWSVNGSKNRAGPTSKDYKVNLAYIGQDQYGGMYVGGDVVDYTGSTVHVYADPDDSDMVIVALTLVDQKLSEFEITITSTMFVGANGDLGGTVSARYKDILKRTQSLFEGFANMSLATTSQ